MSNSGSESNNQNQRQNGGHFESALAKAITAKDFQAIVKTIIANSASVLDIGCGIGDYLKYTNENQRVVAIEPHQPYLEKAREVAPWAEFVNSDALSYFERNSEKFDCILMIDVIEHLEEPDARQLVASARQAAHQIVLSQIPIGDHKQDQDIWNLGGDYWQTHRSTWDESKVAGLGFTFHQIWRDWYEWDDPEKSRDTSIAIWSQHPLVSIVMPSYNQAEWLPKSLDSVLAQTYPFWEAVVVNDGSTDRTAEVIAEYARRDSRIRGVHKPNGGISSALNRGIEEARGQYFCWLSSDDLFYPDKLRLQVEAFKQLDEKYAIVFGPFDYTDPNDNVQEFNLTKPFYDGLEFPQCLKYDYIDGCTIMIPMRIMREVGGFNLQFKHAQDTELWMRLAAKDYRFFWLDQKLTLRRVHPNQGFTDFALDCRFDGNSMIDFYLGKYSLLDFYRHIDFNKKEDLWLFIKQFYNILADPDCLINHATLQNVFWEWFRRGLLMLEPKIRAQILDAGIYSFKAAAEKGQFWAAYHQKLSDLAAQIRLRPREKAVRNNRFEDITKFNRATERHYSDILFKHGEHKLFKEENLPEALSVFKYLCDYENPNYNRAFIYFRQIVNTLGKYDTFLRSFRRKASIRQFPDDVKAYYIWSKLQMDGATPEVDDLTAGISDPALRAKAESWKQPAEMAFLKAENIGRWNYWVDPKNINHALDIRCPVCGKTAEYRYALPVAPDPQERAGICVDCFSAFRFSDGLLGDYFWSRMIAPAELRAADPDAPRVTYVMRYSNLIGGGVKKIYQHIQWLAQLGCRIKIYSVDDPPQWIKLPGEFIKVRDHYDDDLSDADLVVVFSIYDVPKVLTKVPPDRVAHICQGYEGYHLGDSFEKMRSDKFFYTALHSLPVNNILVSKHLMNMFRDKFGREGCYVPNGVDLNEFFPDWNVEKEPRSIAFIGNPADKLKGVTFLLESLEKLQNTATRLGGVNLHIIWGGQNPGFGETFRKIPGLTIRYHNNLSGGQVAQLLRRMTLLVVTSWYEGFSLPALEGMACGVPVITTNNMGAESFCRDGINSYIVKYGDTNRFADLIGKILGGRIPTGELLYEGYRTAVEYSEQNSVTAFIRAFEFLLKINFDPETKSKLTDQAVAHCDTAAHLHEFRRRADSEWLTAARELLTGIRYDQKIWPYKLEHLQSYRGELPEVHLALAFHYLTLRNLTSFETHANPALKGRAVFFTQNRLNIGPDYGLAILAEVALLMGDRQVLMEILGYFNKMQPGSLRQRWLQLKIAVILGSGSSSVELDKLLEVVPGYAPAEKLRRILTTGRQPQLADLQEIIRDDPRLSADIYLHVFRSASRDLEENRVDQARAAFKTILTEAPQSVDSLYGLALCECQERNFKAADEYLKQVIAGQEDYAPAYNQLGVIAYLGNKYAEARKYFGIASRINPDYLDARRNQSEALLALQEYDQAVQSYFEIIRDFPDDIPSLVRLAQIYNGANRPIEAREYAGQVLSLDPGNSEMQKIFNS